MYGVAIGVATLGLSFWPVFGLGIVASVVIALVSGIFAVRLTWHYFAIITVVFSLIFYFFAVSVKPLTGGDDGINFSLPPTFSFGGVNGKLQRREFSVLLHSGDCFALLFPHASRDPKSTG
jgi:branched-chain amino acid transport system permease protein